MLYYACVDAYLNAYTHDFHNHLKAIVITFHISSTVGPSPSCIASLSEYNTNDRMSMSHEYLCTLSLAGLPEVKKNGCAKEFTIASERVVMLSGQASYVARCS